MSHKIGCFVVLALLWIAIGASSAAANTDSTTYRLAFLSRTDTVCEFDQGQCFSVIDVVNIDGSDRHHLVSGKFWTLGMVASPDLSRFLFFSPGNSPRDIFIANVSDGRITQITNMQDMSICSAQWSPDGKNIVFNAEPLRDGNTTLRSDLLEIYVISTDKSVLTESFFLSHLTDNNANEFSPSWSPNGQQIAFISDQAGTDQIYIMNSDGTNQQRLTTEEISYFVEWSWSPDSRFLLLNRYTQGIPTIFSIEVATGHEYQLTNGFAALYPVWSPDGRKITFYSDYDGDYEIYVMNSDGTSRQQLTTNKATDFGPEWSPDSKFIAFISDRDGTEELYVMNADGTNQTRLTYGGGVGPFIWIAGD